MANFCILFAMVLAAMACPAAMAGDKDQPVIIGLDADMSSGSAESGVAIKRGIELALDEINARGGVLGRPMALVVRDHHGNPARGIDNIIEFAQMSDLVAVVGGLHTPVALAELKTIHAHKVIYLGPWAAGTTIVDNGYQPNFVFRISVRDQFAGAYLIDQAMMRGYKRPGLLLENTGWGRSNRKAMISALERYGLAPSTIQWFNWGAGEVSEQLRIIVSAESDVVLLVANAPEGSVVIRDMAALSGDERVPIISHWGVTGGDFFLNVRSALDKVDFMFLQTFSFVAPNPSATTTRVARAYLDRYADSQTVGNIKSPVGTAHAYDLVHILALAIEKAQSFDRAQIRRAMEQVENYAGLVRFYSPPFTSLRHDALSHDDFNMARYDQNGTIVLETVP